MYQVSQLDRNSFAEKDLWVLVDKQWIKHEAPLHLWAYKTNHILAVVTKVQKV